MHGLDQDDDENDRVVDPTTSAQNRAATQSARFFPVLQMFHFNRIVLDEFHDLVLDGGVDDPGSGAGAASAKNSGLSSKLAL